MKTTRKQAVLFYEITKHINPYEVDDSDKKEILKNILNESFESNLNYLIEFFELDNTPATDILNDKILIKLFNKLYKTTKYIKIELKQTVSKHNQVKQTSNNNLNDLPF